MFLLGPFNLLHVLPDGNRLALASVGDADCGPFIRAERSQGQTRSESDIIVTSKGSGMSKGLV